jgi:putative hydrolase of the HAD superfamily
MAVRAAPERPTAVTFDCWATLLYEPPTTRVREMRHELLASAIGVERPLVTRALERAWNRHSALWHRKTVFGGRDMLESALADLEISLAPANFEELLAQLEDVALLNPVCALDGAREALQRLADVGVRRALICDTGFSPGRVVRQLLDRVGLLELLEVQVFSEEIGAPKPDGRPFHAALGALGVDAAAATHVGDMRRSDVAGARALGMGSIRITAQHDDNAGAAYGAVLGCAEAGCDPTCPQPEADAVVSTYAELLEVIGY